MKIRIYFRDSSRVFVPDQAKNYAIYQEDGGLFCREIESGIECAENGRDCRSQAEHEEWAGERPAVRFPVTPGDARDVDANIAPL